jgi:hypothetical protein
MEYLLIELTRKKDIKQSMIRRKNRKRASDVIDLPFPLYFFPIKKKNTIASTQEMIAR